MRRPESRPCWWCREAFVAKRKDVIYCSTECAKLHRTTQEEAKRAAWLKRNAGLMRRIQAAHTPRDFAPRPCGRCGKAFAPHSGVHRYCATCKPTMPQTRRTAKAFLRWLRDEPGHVVTCDPAFHGGLVE